MKNILITVSALDIGGVEMRTIETVEYIQRKGIQCQVYIYVISGRKGVLDRRAESAGAKIIYASGKKFHTYLGLARAIKSNCIDVIHVNASYASGIINAIAFFAGAKRRISHIRSASFPEMARWKKLKYLMYLPLLRIFSTKVVGVTAAAQEVAKVPSNKWRTLYDGLKPPVPNEKSNECGTVTICVMGRMHPCKNLDLAAEIITELHVLYSVGVKVKFIGKEDQEIKQRLVARFGSKSFHAYSFLGPLEYEAAMSELAASDILLLTSVREGLPGVCIEAIAMGVPVVASDLPGVMELQRGLRGITTISLKAPIEEWCEAIVCSHKSNVDHAGLVNSFKVSPFTIERHVESLCEVWGV